ncbi:VWA domain-containing protein [Nocardioides panacisoli]|uniref:vWA domain-containing protein n=1 Tax=Nocardioides panacisoli TaxID=627624 RepID=UPI001C6361AF|nr:VWA domain-containing protein [Nocardioides panacisoli]QYJ04037.1 VWA domain-containing protein [Nocardioides panacisoli]
MSVRAEADHGADEVLLGFARALRSAGVAVTQDRSQAFLAAAAIAGADDRRATYAAGRATLCASPDDLARYDRIFVAWFGGEPLPTGRRPAANPTPVQVDLGEGEGGGEEDSDGDVVPAAASDTEVLRHRDVASMSAAERRHLAALFSSLRPRTPTRPTARHVAWHRGRIDAARTLRASLRNFGEPTTVRWRRRGTRSRRVVLLVDVSGSMSGYADALLRLAHRMTTASRCGRGASRSADRPSGHRVETFTLGTRLTHLTRALRARDPERALAAAGATVPDWSGGTRLGETLEAFVDRWGRRGMARGAVVVIFSDGWERGDPALLAEQLARLQRLAHRVIWVNPHRGKQGYEPVQGGVRAALPHLDAFLAGHSLATYAELMEVVGDA